MQIHMSAKEQSLFESFVKLSKGYFEFGMGGSTVYAAKVVQGPVVAIDSDPTWIKKVATECEPSPYERNLIAIDIGATGYWGYPISDSKKDNFPHYSSAIIEHSNNADLCLVDGRFRVACFLQAIKYLGDDAIVGFHDFRSRPHYYPVLEFGRPIAEAEDMTFFVRQRSIDTYRLDHVISNYIFVPQ